MSNFEGPGDFQINADDALVENLRHHGPGGFVINGDGLHIRWIIGAVTVNGDFNRIDHIVGDLTVVGNDNDIGAIRGDLSITGHRNSVFGVRGDAVVNGNGMVLYGVRGGLHLQFCNQAVAEVVAHGGPQVWLEFCNDVTATVDVREADEHGVIVQGCGDSTVLGRVAHAGQSAANTYDNVHVMDGSVGCSILVAKSRSASGQTRAGVNLVSSVEAEDCIVDGVDFGAASDYGTAPLIDNGMNTRVGTNWWT